MKNLKTNVSIKFTTIEELTQQVCGTEKIKDGNYIAFINVNVDNFYKECFADVTTYKNGDLIKIRKVPYNSLSLKRKVKIKNSRMFIRLIRQTSQDNINNMNKKEKLKMFKSYLT